MVPAGWLSGFPQSSDPWSSIGTSCMGSGVYLDPQREVKYLIDSLQQAWKREWECKKKSKQLLSEKNWWKRSVCWFQHSMSITFRTMGLPCENGNNTTRTGNAHVSLQPLSTINMSEKHSVIVYCPCCTVCCWNELLPKFIQIYSNQI